MTASLTLLEVLTDSLCHLTEMPLQTAEDLASAIIQTAAERGYAGVDYYLPQASHLSRAERNRQIRAKFNGRNLPEICREYGLSKRSVYRITRYL